MSQESKALAEKAQKLSGKQVGDLLMNNMLVIIMIVAAIAIAIYRRPSCRPVPSSILSP